MLHTMTLVFKVKLKEWIEKAGVRAGAGEGAIGEVEADINGDGSPKAPSMVFTLHCIYRYYFTVYALHSAIFPWILLRYTAVHFIELNTLNFFEFLILSDITKMQTLRIIITRVMHSYFNLCLKVFNIPGLSPQCFSVGVAWPKLVPGLNYIFELNTF